LLVVYQGTSFEGKALLTGPKPSLYHFGNEPNTSPYPDSHQVGIFGIAAPRGLGLVAFSS
jgi:hypothetical protein